MIIRPLVIAEIHCMGLQKQRRPNHQVRSAPSSQRGQITIAS
jgi:hypothetical protein